MGGCVCCNTFNKLALELKNDAVDADPVDGSGVDGKIAGDGRGITACSGKEK